MMMEGWYTVVMRVLVDFIAGIPCRPWRNVTISEDDAGPQQVWNSNFHVVQHQTRRESTSHLFPPGFFLTFLWISGKWRDTKDGRTTYK